MRFIKITGWRLKCAFSKIYVQFCTDLSISSVYNTDYYSSKPSFHFSLLTVSPDNAGLLILKL